MTYVTAILVCAFALSWAIVHAARDIRRGLEAVRYGPQPGQAAPPTLGQRIHGLTEPAIDPTDARPRPEYKRPMNADPGSLNEGTWLWAIEVVENKGQFTEAEILEAEEILTKERM